MIYGECYQFSKTLVRLFSNVIIPTVTCGKLGFAFLASVYKLCRQLCVSHRAIMSRSVDSFCILQFSHTALAGTDSAPFQGDFQVSILYVFAETLHIGVFVLQQSNHAVIITSTFHDIGERVLVRDSSTV